MIKYIAIANFTANINGNHKQFKSGEVFLADSPVPELDGYCFDLPSKYKVENDKLIPLETLHGLVVKIEEKEEKTFEKSKNIKK